MREIGDWNLPTVPSVVGKRYEVELVQSRGRCSVFHMSMGVFEHIGRGVVVYVFLFVLLRFVGKKHVGQLAPFDLLVLLIAPPPPNPN